jgi:hypothetical protein
MLTTSQLLSRRLFTTLGSFGFSLAVWGCVPTFSDETSQISERRVLAIRSEPAEPKPGASVTLHALLVDKEGELEDAGEVAWAFCLSRKPLTELGPIAPECLTKFGKETAEVPEIGVGENVIATIPSDACRRFGPLSPPLEPGQTVPGRAADPDTTGGFFQPILAGEDDPVVSRVRLLCGPSGLPQSESVVFNQGYRPNEHPSPSELFVVRGKKRESIDGEIEVRRGDSLEFVAQFPSCPSEPDCGDGLCTAYENATVCPEDCAGEPVGCSGPEGYLYADPEQRATVLTREHLEIGWFSSGGRFELATTDDADEPGLVQNVWQAPERTGEMNVWLVVRDDRGGISWQAVRIRVSP